MNKHWLLLFLHFSLVTTIVSIASAQPLSWDAPENANDLINPFPADETSIQLGESLYNQNCFLCHDKDGRGNTEYAKELLRAPGDLTSNKIQTQTDGALFWKITEGRPPMLSYKYTLSSSQLWALVNYLRVLGNAKNINKEIVKPVVEKDNQEDISPTIENLDTVVTDTILKESKKDSIPIIIIQNDKVDSPTPPTTKKEPFHLPDLSFHQYFIFLGFTIGFGAILWLILVLNNLTKKN